MDAGGNFDLTYLLLRILRPRPDDQFLDNNLDVNKPCLQEMRLEFVCDLLHSCKLCCFLETFLPPVYWAIFGN